MKRFQNIIILYVIVFINVTNISAQEIFCVRDEWTTGKYNFVDKQNRVLFSGNYRLISPFTEGVGIVQFNDINQTTAYIDTTGKLIRPQLPRGSYGKVILYPFSSNYGLVSYGVTVSGGRHCFFVNKNGEIMTEEFANAHSFSEGVAVVQLNNGTYRAIDTNLRTLFEIRSAAHDKDENTWFFKSGLLPVMNVRGEWGYIDKTGQLIIQPNLEFGANFNGDFAIARSNNFIFNKSGESIYIIEEKLDIRRQPMRRYPYIFNNKLIILDSEVTIHDLVNGSNQDVIIRISTGGISSPLFRFHALNLGEYFVVYNGIYNFSGERLATIPDNDVYYPNNRNTIWYNRYWVSNDYFVDLLQGITQ